jgi:hypothetical protein
MEKFTVSVGCRGAHGHSGLLGQGPASWSTPTAFGQPTMHRAWLVHGQCARTVRSTCGHRSQAQSSTLRWRSIGDKVFTSTIAMALATSSYPKT